MASTLALCCCPSPASQEPPLPNPGSLSPVGSVGSFSSSFSDHRFPVLCPRIASSENRASSTLPRRLSFAASRSHKASLFHRGLFHLMWVWLSFRILSPPHQVGWLGWHGDQGPSQSPGHLGTVIGQKKGA